MNDSYQESTTFKELYKGMQKSQRNVMWKDSVAGYSLNGLKNTYKLRQALLKKTYKIDPYQIFQVHEPKEREIVATRIKDRQFQRSLCDNVLYPQVTKHFIYDNCACLRGKGVDFALNRMNCHLQRYYRKHGRDGWVLQCDIHHYFAETPHNVAKYAIAKRVDCPDTVSRVSEIIDSFGGDKGIGLGSQVSQITQLAVLDDLDHFIKERLKIKQYIRYMDDFVLIHHDKAHLQYCLEEIRMQLAKIGLSMNKKTNLYPLRQGLVFLKWHYYLSDTGKVVRKMSHKALTKERRKLKKLKTVLDAGKITMQDVRNHYQSWTSNTKRGSTYNVRQAMDKHYFKIFEEEPIK